MRRLLIALLCLAAFPADALAATDVRTSLLASDGTGYSIAFFADLDDRTAAVGLQSDAVIDQGEGAALVDAPAVATVPLADGHRVTAGAVRNCIRTGVVSLYGTTAGPVRRLHAAYSDGRAHDVSLRRPPSGWHSNARVFAILLESRAATVRLTAYDRHGRRLTSLRRSLGQRCGRTAALPRIVATMAPATLTPGNTEQVLFRLTLPARSKSVDGHWRVTAELPGFVSGHDPFTSADPLDPFGSPFTPASAPVLEGPGTITGGGPGTESFGAECRRGFDAPAAADTIVTVPGGSTSTVAWAFLLSKAQRWAATDPRVTFRVRNDAGAGARFRPAAPTVRGRFGTRFGLSTRRAGRVVTVVGSTEPPLRRGRVSLMAAAVKREIATITPNPTFPEDFGAAGAIATFRTDRSGHFAYRWRAPEGRVLDLWAGSFTEHGRRGDSSCHLRLDTR